MRSTGVENDDPDDSCKKIKLSKILYKLKKHIKITTIIKRSPKRIAAIIEKLLYSAMKHSSIKESAL